MATNTCINPYLSTDLYEWDCWEGSLTRQAIAGLDRSWAARRSVTAAGYNNMLTARGSVALAEDVTVSLTAKSSVALNAWDASLDIQFCDSNLNVLSETSYSNLSAGMVANVPLRISRTAEVPANAVFVRGHLQWSSPSAQTMDLTMCRITSDADSPSTYFDGMSPGWRWTGAAGASASETIPAAVVGGYIWSGSAWVAAKQSKVFNGNAWV